MTKQFCIDLIKEQQNLISKSNKASEKVNYLNTIIRIKKEIYSNKNYDTHVYLDIKDWINYYLESIEENSYGYDSFNKDVIENIFNLVDYECRIILYNYLIRHLKIKFHSDSIISWCEDRIKNLELKLILQDCSITNFMKLILKLSSYNIYALIITLIILFALINLVLLPEEYTGMNFFVIKYENYLNEQFVLNHIINVSNYLFDLSNGKFEITCISIYGVIILIFIKIIFYFIILNFIIKEIIKKVNN